MKIKAIMRDQLSKEQGKPLSWALTFAGCFPFTPFALQDTCLFLVGWRDKVGREKPERQGSQENFKQFF